MIEPAVLIFDNISTIINFNSSNFDNENLISTKFFLSKNVITNLLKLKNYGFNFIQLRDKNIQDIEKNNLYYLIDNILNSQGIYFSDYIEYVNFISLQDYVLNKLKFNENIYFITKDSNKLNLGEKLFINNYLFDEDNFNWDIIVEKILNIHNIGISNLQPRSALVTRKTKETEITAKVFLDVSGNNEINTGIGFFDHMLDQIATHGGFVIHIKCKGDLNIDDHHTIEDTALVLGEAIKKALKDKRGINRFGFVLPLDESVAKCILDLSGRPYLKFKAKFDRDKVGDFSCEMVEHFFRSLSFSLACTLHLKCKGKNDHHKIESLFKAFGRTLRQAIKIQSNELPSSKGLL